MLNKQYYVEKAKVDRLVARKNTKADFYNGIYDRYEYPVLTREFAPVHWRYDLDEETNPYFMERLGINAVMNSGAIELNGKYYLVAERGDCILFQPHHDTAILHLPGEKVEFFGFIFTGELLPELFRTFRLDRAECITVRDPEEQTAFCQSILDSMEENPDRTSRMRTAGKVYEFYQRLALEKRAQESNDFADKVREYLVRNFRQEISIESLASLFQVCQTTLTARFAEKFHQTPFQFLKQIRIEHAARLLVESKLSGKEIAGFFSPQHFCTEFQKYYGMTPGNYRRMFQR